MDKQLFVNDTFLRNETCCRFVTDFSRLNYKKVTFNNVRNVKDNKRLWTHLGNCVQKIHINKSRGFLSEETKDFLADFQELNELTLVLSSNWKNFYQFDTIPKKLERLNVVLDRYQGSLDNFRIFLHNASNLTELEIESTSFHNEELLMIIKKFSSILTKLSISLSNSDIKEFEHINSYKKLKILSLVLPETQSESKIQQLLETFANISYLELKINGFVPSKSFKNLKSLEIEQLIYDPVQLKLIHCLTGLEKLTIDYKSPRNSQEHCFFVHERLQNHNLRTLQIFQRSSSACLTCMESLCQSFPKLRDFTTNLPLINKHLSFLPQHCTKLTHLRVEFTPNEILEPLLMVPVTDMKGYQSLSLHSLKITNEHLLSWPMMPTLVSLSINLDSTCIEDSFKEFIKNVPFLENISFVSFVTNDMIFAVVDSCERLKSISTLSYNNSRVTKDGLNYVVRNGRSIRKIEFHCIKSVSMEELKMLKQGNNSIVVYTADSVKCL